MGEKSGRNQVRASRCPLRAGAQVHAIAQQRRVSTCKVLPTREAHGSLGVQGFCWGSVTDLQHSFQGEYFKGSEPIFWELAKGHSWRQAFLGNVQDLSSSRLLSYPFPAQQVDCTETSFSSGLPVCLAIFFLDTVAFLGLIIDGHSTYLESAFSCQKQLESLIGLKKINVLCSFMRS